MPPVLQASPEVLRKHLERRPILWVGAGLSVAAGLPSTRVSSRPWSSTAAVTAPTIMKSRSRVLIGAMKWVGDLEGKSPP